MPRWFWLGFAAATAFAATGFFLRPCEPDEKEGDGECDDTRRCEGLPVFEHVRIR